MRTSPIRLPWLTAATDHFPWPDLALRDPDGLLCAGGDLEPARLWQAYRHGIFPWYEDGQPILWWSPSIRCVLWTSQVHVSRSMKRALRDDPFRYSFDLAFAQVIHACAAPRRSTDRTWITRAMIDAYIRLHQMGLAHSIEVWQNDQLVGGLYGIHIGGCFFGESMFSRSTNASKAALIRLCAHLSCWKIELLDCQVENDHLSSMGANKVPREAFLQELRSRLDQNNVADWKIRAEICRERVTA